MYLEEYIKGEIVFNIENIVNNEFGDKETVDKIANLQDYEIAEICTRILDSQYFIDTLNQLVNEEIESEIYHYINNDK